MYTFIDNLNGESLTLRPEGTAGTLRAALEHNLLYHAPQKLWYMGPMFRHERPQKGRYRQFHQVGAEALGFAGPDVDAELIVMTSELWRRLGLSGDVRLEINTLGDLSERTAYRRALVAYLERYSDQLDEESRRRLYTNPLRVLDTKHPALQDIVNRAPRLIDYLGDESLAHYQHWKALLDGLGIAWQENPRLVRGLDYYNRSVFEWVTDALGAQGALCAGGRYDGLAQLLGGKPTPAVGFAMGMERIVLLLREKDGLPTHTAADIYLVSRGQGADLYAMQLAQTLRRAGHSVIQHLGSGNFKSQMKKADHSGARVAMIVGEVEVASCQVVMKPLRQQQAQQTVALEHVVAALAKILGSSATRQ